MTKSKNSHEHHGIMNPPVSVLVKQTAATEAAIDKSKESSRDGPDVVAPSTTKSTPSVEDFEDNTSVSVSEYSSRTLVYEDTTRT